MRDPLQLGDELIESIKETVRTELWELSGDELVPLAILFDLSPGFDSEFRDEVWDCLDISDLEIDGTLYLLNYSMKSSWEYPMAELFEHCHKVLRLKDFDGWMFGTMIYMLVGHKHYEPAIWQTVAKLLPDIEFENPVQYV